MQLFPEPRLLRCRYCNHGFPRISIAYHVFYCRSGLMFEFLDQTENDQNDTYKEYVRSLFFFLSLSYCSLSLVSPFSLPKGINLSALISYYQNCCSTLRPDQALYLVPGTPLTAPDIASLSITPAQYRTFGFIPDVTIYLHTAFVDVTNARYGYNHTGVSHTQHSSFSTLSSTLILMPSLHSLPSSRWNSPCTSSV